MSERKFPPLTECRWTIRDRLQFLLLATRIEAGTDEALGKAMFAVAKKETVEGWAIVHERLNVIGRPDLAERLRQLVRGEADENGR